MMSHNLVIALNICNFTLNLFFPDALLNPVPCENEKIKFSLLFWDQNGKG